MHKPNNKYIITLSISFVLLVWFSFCLPKQLFNNPTSTVITNVNGDLLAAQIATDGQWRFPYNDSIPDKFERAIIYFEDQYFYKHPGINPFSIIRAIKQNVKAKKVVSGGSTITAQVIRMSRQGKQRTVMQKLIEFVLAVRIEIKYSKAEILALYVSNAPFGGNVVGLDAAAWRYYGRSPEHLSWSEVTTLAVLPNAPSLIYPGKNHEILLKKRNRLLDKLRDNNVINQETCELAKFENLPQKPLPIPQLTPHLLTRVINEGKSGERIKSTINKNLQKQTLRIIDKHYQVLSQNDILNAAAIIIDVKTGNTLAYVGNTKPSEKESGKYVDVITAHRSTGSTLKPLLYTLMQKDGVILPNTLIPDIPTHIAGYSPKNFDKNYSGAVTANSALARSLNIPAVRMLRDYGLERFHENLQQMGLTTFSNAASHYGLSIILGGAETTLWELSGLYTNMARTLNNFANNNSKYSSDDFHELHYELTDRINSKKQLQNNSILSAASIWLTFGSLTEMQRPVEGADWRLFESSKKIAWKTGTSFGHRDAWAIGITPEYVVGVWIGNADGEGRPGLTGVRAAAPVMFDLFKQLPQTSWFNPPYDELVETVICAKSGYKYGLHCEAADTIYTTIAGLRTETCPYHKQVHLDAEQRFQVSSNCYSVSKMVTKSWFVLPPVIEYYYKDNDPFYKTLPHFHPNCNSVEIKNMEIIYPKESAELFIPRGFNNQKQKLVFELAHRLNNVSVHWHLDEEYLGSTTSIHKMDIVCDEGLHYLTIIDEFGEIITRSFTIIGK